MLDHTNIMPALTINMVFLLITATLATVAPRASEPVSPINTFAGDELNTKYPKSPPTIVTDMADNENNCFEYSTSVFSNSKNSMVSMIENTIK